MSLALLLLAQAATAKPAAPPAPVDDIVVIASRMRLIKVDMRAPKRNGLLVLERCRVTRSSGYAELDAVPCDSARACMADRPATRRALETCVEERSQAPLDTIVDRWRKAREAGR